MDSGAYSPILSQRNSVFFDVGKAGDVKIADIKICQTDISVS